jgi:hypothetical protein
MYCNINTSFSHYSLRKAESNYVTTGHRTNPTLRSRQRTTAYHDSYRYNTPSSSRPCLVSTVPPRLLPCLCKAIILSPPMRTRRHPDAVKSDDDGGGAGTTKWTMPASMPCWIMRNAEPERGTHHTIVVPRSRRGSVTVRCVSDVIKTDVSRSRKV